jgi:hypothetical protein
MRFVEMKSRMELCQGILHQLASQYQDWRCYLRDMPQKSK